MEMLIYCPHCGTANNLDKIKVSCVGTTWITYSFRCQECIMDILLQIRKFAWTGQKAKGIKIIFEKDFIPYGYRRVNK
jgi:hypothetical protein